jgi:bifunctional NMN adenylyltransferase/nudix hydrolase
MSSFDFNIFIGRFSPFHNAHKVILDKALSISKQVIVVLGSASSPRTVRNPWKVDERINMISSSLSEEENKRIHFVHINDYTYNDNLWFATLQQKITDIVNGSTNIALVGFESDETSFYLKSFPQYTYISVPTEYKFHASKVRDLYFSYDISYKEMVPKGTLNYLESFKNDKNFSYLKKEKDFLDDYKERWRGAPFPPIFTTVDCVVIKSGHVLVVTRKTNPGKGLYALPGGFVNQKEKIKDAALRELKEETGIKINLSDLKKSITNFRVFDDPFRSERGRVITNAFLINLGTTGALPYVKGADDAEKACWLPLGEFQSLEDSFFDDHYHIIKYFESTF